MATRAEEDRTELDRVTEKGLLDAQARVVAAQSWLDWARAVEKYWTDLSQGTEPGPFPIWTWRSWEISSSLSAQIDQAEDSFHGDVTNAAEPGNLKAAADGLAEAVRELAEVRREAAQNIVDGFGHETSQSEELSGVADELESWADEIESWEEPELPDPDDADCDECGGSGQSDCPDCGGSGELDEADCLNCGGSGTVECEICGGDGLVSSDDPSDEQMAEWIENARSEAEALTASRPY